MYTNVTFAPRVDDADVVVSAPAAGPGNWAGAPSAVYADGLWHLAYRLRRPLPDGRGVATVVASSSDGIEFRMVAELSRDDFGAESFERPALVRRPAGGWRLYVSCATPGSKHWWIEAIDADTLADLPRGGRQIVLAGSRDVAIKDPVVSVHDGRWEMWACEHPLDVPGHEDRMSTAYLTSADGMEWRRHGTALQPTPGGWDARGARVTAILSREPFVALYDGRRSAEENWYETTGVARGRPAEMRPDSAEPVARSPHSDGALRYVSAVELPGGGLRYYFEAARPDGAHDLMTTVSVGAGSFDRER